jgi:hypothetical protein
MSKGEAPIGDRGAAVFYEALSVSVDADARPGELLWKHFNALLLNDFF